MTKHERSVRYEPSSTRAVVECRHRAHLALTSLGLSYVGNGGVGECEEERLDPQIGKTLVATEWKTIRQNFEVAVFSTM